jgi:MFS family permease
VHHLRIRPPNPFSSLYDRNGIADRKLRRDLNLFITAVAAGSMFFTVTSGAPFTDFAMALGADDFHFSIIYAVPAAFAVLQFLASWLLEKTRKRKLIFIVSGIAQRALWIPVALVPVFMPMDKPMLRLWTVIALLSASSAAGMFMNVTFFSWLGDIVPLRIRGRYLSLRYSISTATGLLAVLAASLALEGLPGLVGYAIVFGVLALFGVADIVQFVWIRDPPMAVPKREPFFRTLSGAMKNKAFLLYLLFWTAWSFCWNLPAPFYNKYALETLHISLTAVTLAGQVAFSLMAVLLVQWWGRRLDRHGHHWVLARCGAMLCALPLLWVFAAPGQVWPMLLYSLGAGIFFCGVDVTSVQMLVTATPQRSRSVYIAIYMVVTSIVGMSLANIAGGKLLEWMGDLSFRFAGIRFDRYKVLFAASCALRFIIVMAVLPMVGARQENPENVESYMEKEAEVDDGKESAR